MTLNHSAMTGLVCFHVSPQTQNVSASDHMKIDMQILHGDAEHRVKVRALPINYLKGSWSEWSNTFSFTSPTGRNHLPHETRGKRLRVNVCPRMCPEVRQEGYILLVCLVSLLVVMVSAGFLWKNKYDRTGNVGRHTLHTFIFLLFCPQNIHLHVAKYPASQTHLGADLQTQQSEWIHSDSPPSAVLMLWKLHLLDLSSAGPQLVTNMFNQQLPD